MKDFFNNQLNNDLNILYTFFTKIRSSYSSLNQSFYRIARKKSKFISFYLLLLSIYIALVAYLMNSPIFFDSIRTLKSLVTFLFLIPLISMLLKLFCIKTENIYFLVNQKKQKLNMTTVLHFSMIGFIVFLFLFLVNFPGYLTTDNINQWKQVQNFKYNDWHPVIHTLSIWILSRIINHYAFILFCQIVFFSFGLGLLLATLESWGYSRKVLLVIFLFFVLNPMVKNILMFAYKDTVFTILLTFLLPSLIDIYFSEGKWLDSFLNIFILSFCIAIMTVIRHNGMLYTFPLIIFIFLFYIKKYYKTIFILPLVALLIFLIKVPLYNSLNVVYPNNKYSEVVGVPMSIMCDVMIKNPEAMPLEAKKFLLDAESEFNWMDVYEFGNFSSVKGKFDGAKTINKIPIKDFLKMTLDTIIADKRNSFLAFRDHTAFVWEIFTTECRIISAPWKHVLFSIKNPIKKAFASASVGYDNIIASIFPIGWIFTSNGWHILLLLIFLLGALYRRDFKINLFIIPIIFSTFSTMMLLSASDLRYFQYNSVAVLPLLIISMSKKNNIAK